MSVSLPSSTRSAPMVSEVRLSTSPISCLNTNTNTSIRFKRTGSNSLSTRFSQRSQNCCEGERTGDDCAKRVLAVVVGSSSRRIENTSGSPISSNIFLRSSGICCQSGTRSSTSYNPNNMIGGLLFTIYAAPLPLPSPLFSIIGKLWRKPPISKKKLLRSMRSWAQTVSPTQRGKSEPTKSR